MGSYTKRRVWQSPWGYPESAAIVLGVSLVGVILQITNGSFDFFLLANPVNIFTGLLLFVLSITLATRAKKSSFVRWISSPAMSVTLILSILLLTIIMGLTPQISASSQSQMALGFDSMTSNWSFVLLYAMTLLSLGVVTFRRLLRFHVKDTPFVLQHFGLWLLLLAAGLGYADMERYIMYVNEGETQWRVYGASGEVKELPIAIKLNDFDMDVYPPKLAIINRESGAVQPEGAPEYFQIDPDLIYGSLDGWQIEIDEYIHKAVRGADSSYREVPMPGATPAAKVKAVKDGRELSGWICGGNQMQTYMTMPIDKQLSFVMTPSEPRKFVSDVEVYTEQGDVAAAQIIVNKPLRIGSWQIYQYGYDNNAGALSSYSSFELVYDPWLIPIYIGILFLMLGSLCMVVQGRSRAVREEVLNDME